MPKPYLYLAGPMAGLSLREASGWREHAKWVLEEKWNILSPIDMPYEGGEDPNGLLTVSSQSDDEHYPIHRTPSAYVTADEFYIDKSDFILANFLGAETPSVGTIWELGYAWAQGKKIVSILNPDNPNDHPFIRRRSHIFVPTLEEALDYLKCISI